MLPLLFVLSITLPPLCPHRDPDPNASETDRVRLHFSKVLERVSAVDASALTAEPRGARAARLSDLAAYAEAGVFPRNPDFDDRAMPYFIGDDGAHCAMAWLLASDGEDELARRVAATDPNVFVADLALDPEFGAWLDRNGLTLVEAAHIQPSYPRTEVAADCVCYTLMCAQRAEDGGFDSVEEELKYLEFGCAEPPLEVSDFAGCPRVWPAYPDLPRPRVSEALLQRLLADASRCYETLFEDDPRWRYDVTVGYESDPFACASRPGAGSSDTIAPLFLLICLRARRYRAAPTSRRGSRASVPPSTER
jgi:hypothetical protein